MQEQAKQELLLALRIREEDSERGDIRLADWALWWGWRLIEALEELDKK